MALVSSDIDLVCHTLLDLTGEDYFLASRLLDKLERRFPAVAWRTRFHAILLTRPDYTTTGLSVAWWEAEVVRLTNALK